MAGLLPLIFALALADIGAGSTGPVPGPLPMAIGLTLALILWWLVCETVSRLLGRYAVRRQVARWDDLGQALALLVFAWLCLDLGWPRLSRSSSLAMAPWFAMQCTHWWCLAVAARGIGNSALTRNAMLHSQARLVLLPLALAIGVLDLCFRGGEAVGLDHWTDTHLGRGANLAGSFLVAVGVMALVPALLVRLWGARPLPSGDQRAAMEAAAASAGVRALLLWPSPPGMRLNNALVLGLLPGLRWVLFTDDLLRSLTPRQAVAVLGHELGHARHGHLWLYMVFTALAGMAAFVVLPWLLLAIWWLPGSDRLPTIWVEAGAWLLVLGLLWRIAFGWLSRLCERQADLAGMRLAGGSTPMCEALLAVADGDRRNVDAPSWRHHSIRQRIAFLAAAEDQPELAERHHRLVRRVWLAMMALAILLAAWLGWSRTLLLPD